MLIKSHENSSTQLQPQTSLFNDQYTCKLINYDPNQPQHCPYVLIGVEIFLDLIILHIYLATRCY